MPTLAKSVCSKLHSIEMFHYPWRTRSLRGSGEVLPRSRGPGQSTLSALATVGIHKRNLLEARMVVTTYNPHVQLLSPGPWLVGTTKVYPGVGADIVMESLQLNDLG
jgi:hypothetical protein